MTATTTNERRVPRNLTAEAPATNLTRRDLSGIGRDELEMMLIAETVMKTELSRENARLSHENAAMLENLAATQARCNEMLQDFRASKFVDAAWTDGVSARDRGMVVNLAAAIIRARAKHPNGPDGMRSLAEEVGEVAKAQRHEGEDRVREELLDVAVVALRWWLGETTEAGR